MMKPMEGSADERLARTADEVRSKIYRFALALKRERETINPPPFFYLWGFIASCFSDCRRCVS
jgi:hypothetical protein